MGGEGTVTALIQGMGVYRNIKVRGPHKAQVEAIYGIVTVTDGTPTAVIEMASAAGLWLSRKTESIEYYNIRRGATDIACLPLQGMPQLPG